MKILIDNVLLISIHCNAAGRGDRWLSARGWCAYTTRGNTRADALYTASAPTTPTPTPRKTSTSSATPDAPPSSWTITPIVTSSSVQKDSRA